MPLSMYQASVPVLLQILGSLSKILQKAAAHAEAKKIEPAVLLGARLYPDMFPLTRQVQLVTDHAKGSVARLAGVDIPSYPDTEATFEELQARLAKTVEFLKSFKPAQIDGSEEREIVLTIGGQKMPLKGQTYLVHFALPNFYFHATTAYAILRHSGVEIGKRDFMGAL
jgi:uncharacterized protein